MVPSSRKQNKNVPGSLKVMQRIFPFCFGGLKNGDKEHFFVYVLKMNNKLIMNLHVLRRCCLVFISGVSI